MSQLKSKLPGSQLSFVKRRVSYPFRAMHRVLFLFLFSFILGGKAARPAHKANETLGTCCCFRPGTGEKRVYTGTTCPKRPDGSKDQMPRGCAKKEGDTDAPCLIQKGSLSAPNGVPHPRDLYCENYLIFTCGEHEISIPDEWRNCYIGTSKLRNGGGPAVDPQCPQCKFGWSGKNGGEC